MTDAEALDLAVARTGDARFRILLDPTHPAFNPAYWPHVHKLASGPPPVLSPPTPWVAPPPQPSLPPVLPVPARAWRDRIRTCLYRDPPGQDCGCQSARCWAGRGLAGLVGDRDCYECLTQTE